MTTISYCLLALALVMLTVSAGAHDESHNHDGTTQVQDDEAGLEIVVRTLNSQLQLILDSEKNECANGTKHEVNSCINFSTIKHTSSENICGILDKINECITNGLIKCKNANVTSSFISKFNLSDSKDRIGCQEGRSEEVKSSGYLNLNSGYIVAILTFISISLSPSIIVRA